MAGGFLIYIWVSHYSFCDFLNEDAVCYPPNLLIKDIEISAQIFESLCCLAGEEEELYLVQGLKRQR